MTSLHERGLGVPAFRDLCRKPICEKKESSVAKGAEVFVPGISGSVCCYTTVTYCFGFRHRQVGPR
jgi:hypothetical protein